jgi:uncharacterized protein YydD (DUF2326 family)
MIVAIESSLPSFKTIQFHEGLNVLLADTLPSSTEKQSRNSAGKTSLLEIVHFLHGSNCDPDSIFRTKELTSHSFRGRFLIRGESFVVERSGADPSKIFLVEYGKQEEELPTKTERSTERTYINNTNWQIFLGYAMFALPLKLEGTPYDEPFSPSFRAMFSYFVRRRESGGFIEPQRQAEKQQPGDWQVNLSYLLGLDWQIPFEFQRVRARERSLEELKKAVKQGAFGQVLATVAELRPQLTVAETRTQKLREHLTNFEVLDSYKELARRAARAKTDLQALSREAVSLNETLQHLQLALSSEKPPEKGDLQKVYAAAGVQLPGVALRRFEEVSAFHDSVIKNRRQSLEGEIANIAEQIAAGERRMAALDFERSNILKMLEGRGALEDFVRFQKELAVSEANAAALRERFKAAEILEGETTQLQIDRRNLQRRLQEDHQQRRAVLDEMILLIAGTISELYDDRAGQFVVGATANGPEFRISIAGDRGGGIANVEIFCFDIALFTVVTGRLGGPGFLVHDSHLFDGVDERQIAKALLLGSRAAGANRLQYIVTMNSDIFNALPLSAELDRSKIVLATRLSDMTDTGGIFGLRFD